MTSTEKRYHDMDGCYVRPMTTFKTTDYYAMTKTPSFAGGIDEVETPSGSNYRTQSRTIPSAQVAERTVCNEVKK